MKYAIFFLVLLMGAVFLFGLGSLWYTAMIPGGLLFRSTPVQLLLHSLPTLLGFGIIGGLIAYVAKLTFRSGE